MPKKLTTFLIKLKHWEYWSFGVLYIPIYFYWLYLCLKARSFFFFAASNPTIENGGFLMERKSDIYPLLPEWLYPKTLLIPEGLAPNEIVHKIIAHNFSFPLIVKPDIGFKGSGVRKIYSPQEAASYIEKANFPMLVQECIPYKNEVGIFYYRYPWEEKGKISGIVAKEFLAVTGDGKSTIDKLLLKNPRFILQLKALQNSKGIDLTTVLKKDEKRILVPFGNHARGAKFLDITDKITDTLENSIDDICKKIDGFYFGRLDIMYDNWDDLTIGKNLSIVELNGAGSEPTHMYDPKHSIFFAWREIARHCNILWQISTWNHHYQKFPYLKFKDGLKMFRENTALKRKLKRMMENKEEKSATEKETVMEKPLYKKDTMEDPFSVHHKH